MKKLPVEFTKSGFNHRMVERTGMVAVYERWKGGQPHHFETIRIREADEFVIEGKMIPAGERYPAAEQWGSLGWTFHTLSEARDKAALLNRLA